MKRFIAIMLLLAMAISLTACNLETPPAETESNETQSPETKPATTKPVDTQPTQTQPTEPDKPSVMPLEVLTAGQYISEWSDDYVLLAYVSWDSLTLGDSSAEEYPALANALEDYCLADADWAEETLRDMLPEARTMAKTMGDDFYGFSYETICNVQRADSLILSARFDYDAFTGGMRPYFGTTVLNMNPETGEPVQLSQVITDLTQIPTLITKAMEEKFPDIYEETFDDIGRILKDYSEAAYTWTLGYQGITFYFGSSEIAPAAVGNLDVTIWFDQYPELFAEDYTQIPDGGYAIRLPEHSWMSVDLNPGDDIRDTLYVGLDYEGTLTVTKNENSVEDGGYFAYYADSYLVTPDNEHFFLYVDSSAENDYSTFRIFDLNTPEPRLLALFEGHGFSGMWDDDYVLGPNWFNAVFNDPTHFLLARHLDILGTMSGTRLCHMDPETGLLVFEQDYYTLPEDREPLVTKIAITVKQLPGEKDMEIPAGTKLWFLRSDGKTYVDMLLANGSQCRIYVTYRGWQGYINGIAEDECFEGIMYAG